jgi:hypothetical protein
MNHAVYDDKLWDCNGHQLSHIFLDVMQALFHQSSSFSIAKDVAYEYEFLLYIQVLIRIIIINVIGRIRVVQDRPSCCNGFT